MGLFGQYVHKNKKGDRYWLHLKVIKKINLYYFSKNPDSALSDIPSGYEVTENPKTGLPFLRKKKSTKKK
jgi:hypothetical protein